MTDKVKVGLWLPKEKKALLKRLAQAQKRSMSNLNELMIDQYIKRHRWNKGIV